MSEVQCSISEVRYSTFGIRSTKYEIRHSTFEIRCPIFDLGVNMKHITRIPALIIMSCIMIFGCGRSEPPKSPDEVKLQLKWLHQAQFAGFYMAQEKGYYAKENIKVTLLEGGQDVDISGNVIS